jgi:hypothetical protein
LATNNPEDIEIVGNCSKKIISGSISLTERKMGLTLSRNQRHGKKILQKANRLLGTKVVVML